MNPGFAIIGDSKKGGVFEEEKALFKFYSNHDGSRDESGETEFHFNHLKVLQLSAGGVILLKGAVLIAPNEKNNFFVLTSEPYNYGVVINRPCDILKLIEPADENPDTIAFIAREAIRLLRSEDN